MAPMGNAVIRADGVGKRYQLGRREVGYRTLRETLAGAALRPARKLRSLARGAPWRRQRETMWALKDICLEVPRGEVLGIIGRNGAGKTTLLKILSRITEPTTGRVELRGRVGSLLEVGTGFHPELTGRENIYLNGAILGMKRAEIEDKFDDIVAFAEIERFLDTPVKRYSSGMYVRLAFSVAAHLEPEILLVDEVLAVGDTRFQSKCLGKMGEIADDGRTVLFVSHNLGAITSLCSRAVLLDHGRITADGPSNQVAARYLSVGADASPVIDADAVDDRRGPGPCRIQRLTIGGAEGGPRIDFAMGESMKVVWDLVSDQPVAGLVLAAVIQSTTGVPVHHIVSVDAGFELEEWAGSTSVSMVVEALALYPGEYVLSFWVGDGHGNDSDFWIGCSRIRVAQGSLITRDGLSWAQAMCFTPARWDRIDHEGV